MTAPTHHRPTPVISVSGWYIETLPFMEGTYGSADATVRGPVENHDLGGDAVHFSQVFHYRLVPDEHTPIVVGINTLTDLLKVYSGASLLSEVYFSNAFQELYAARLQRMRTVEDRVTSEESGQAHLVGTAKSDTVPYQHQELEPLPGMLSSSKPVLRPVQVTDGLGNQSVQLHSPDGKVQVLSELTVGGYHEYLGNVPIRLGPTITDGSYSAAPAFEAEIAAFDHVVSNLRELASKPANLPARPSKLPDGKDPRQTMSKADGQRMDEEQKDCLILFTKRAPTAPWESALIQLQPEVPEWNEHDPSRGRYIRIAVSTSFERTTYVFSKQGGRPDLTPLELGEPVWTHVPWTQAQLLLDWNAIEPILGVDGVPIEALVSEEESTWGEARAANDETTHIDGVNIQVVGNIPEDSVSLTPLTSRVPFREGERPFSIQSRDGSPFFVAKPDLEEPDWWEVYIAHDAPLSKLLPPQMLLSDDHTVTEYIVVFEDDNVGMCGMRYLESDASTAEEAAPITTSLASRQYVFMRPWGRKGLRLLREGPVVRFPTKPKISAFPIP